MIESAMIFALGFLAAALIALLIIPAVNSRADRLARRRTAALFPLSIAELTAEKDHLRAEFAVLQRRIERKAEEAMAYKHQAMEELGRRAVRIEALETTRAERDQHISGLQTDLADTRQRLASVEEEFAATRITLSTTRDTLAAVENAHRRTLEELATTRNELERTNATLAGTRAELQTTQDRLAALTAAHADLTGRHEASLSDLDAKRITISDLETRLATQTARSEEFERSLAERRSEIHEERQRLAELARDLLAEQERSVALEQRVLDLEQERDTKSAEASALSDRLASGLTGQSALPHAKAESTEGLERELADTRAERARLSRELETLLRTAPKPSEELRAENAELRRRIDELADHIMGASGEPDKATKSKGRRSAAG